MLNRFITILSRVRQIVSSASAARFMHRTGKLLLLSVLSSIIAAGLFVGTASWSGSVNSVFASTCLIQSSTNYPIVVGATQGTTSGLGGVSADLWNYTPKPVWGKSAFWVMAITTLTANHWAQIGWAMWGDDTQSRVFLQLYPDFGAPITLYYHSNGTWSKSHLDAVSPTASVLYEVYQYNGSWNFSYNYGTSYTSQQTNWTPNQVKIAGETLEFHAASPTNKGDHFPGDASNPIHADFPQHDVNGIWSSTALQITTNQGNGAVDKNNGSGDGIRVWDTRCSS